MLPQPFQQKLPTWTPCTSAELFVPLQCCETQTGVNLRAPSLPGKLLIKQRGDKLSQLHLCSCIQVSGLGDKSTKVFVQLFIRVPKRDYFPFPCFHLQWKVTINFEDTCILNPGEEWREKQCFSLPKGTGDTHLTYDWLWILETQGEQCFYPYNRGVFLHQPVPSAVKHLWEIDARQGSPISKLCSLSSAESHFVRFDSVPTWLKDSIAIHWCHLWISG